MISHREQAVRVWREIDACDFAAVGEHDLDQPGSLVREAIVIIPPCSGREQHVEAGNPGSPGQPPRLLEPLAVLHGLGSAHHGERFVRRNMPCRPVSVYPSSQPWQLCSDSTSITRPSCEI